MDTSILEKFADEIKKKTEIINTLPSKQAMDEQIKLSMYMSNKIQEFISIGYNINTIQKYLSGENYPTNTTKTEPKKNLNQFSREIDMTKNYDDIKILPTDCFIAIDEHYINDFTSGKISEPDFLKLLLSCDNFVTIQLEIIEAMLCDYGKKKSLSSFFSTGEMITNKDNEALEISNIYLTDEDYVESVICEPAVYKTAKEVKAEQEQIEKLRLDAFNRKLSPKKLAEYLELLKREKTFIRKYKKQIKTSIDIEFYCLQQFYKQASNNNKAIVLISYM